MGRHPLLGPCIDYILCRSSYRLYQRSVKKTRLFVGCHLFVSHSRDSTMDLWSQLHTQHLGDAQLLFWYASSMAAQSDLWRMVGATTVCGIQTRYTQNDTSSDSYCLICSSNLY